MTEITLLGKSVQNLIQYDICSIVRSAAIGREKYMKFARQSMSQMNRNDLLAWMRFCSRCQRIKFDGFFFCRRYQWTNFPLDGIFPCQFDNCHRFKFPTDKIFL